MSHIEHRAAAPTSVRCYVLTISDSRTEATDTSGRAIQDLLSGKGHQVTGRQILPDDPARVRAALRAQLANPDVQAILTTGGTGISSRDNSYEAIDSLLEKRLTGFGELFRALSYQEIGRRGDLEPRVCGHLAREGDSLGARVRARGTPGDDEADPARARTPRARGGQIVPRTRFMTANGTG